MKPIHTLLATTGASPQVITETMYALHYDNAQWPDEIFLITTTVVVPGISSTLRIVPDQQDPASLR